MSKNLKATVVVYKSVSEAEQEGNTASRAIIAQTETQEDGTFIVSVTDVEEYDITVIKPGYLSYTITGIETQKSQKVEAQELKLVAGDVVQTGEIDLSDLVSLNDNFGLIIDEYNKDDKGLYDFNEDGVVDVLDKNILKANYGKKAQTVEWVN